MDHDRLPFRSRASLIERLVDLDPQTSQEARPLRTLNREELKGSIARNLTWLFNTRSSHPHRYYGQRELTVGLTVIDYGIPDFGALFTNNPEDQTLVAGRLELALAAFEPRLDQIRVELSPDPINEKRLRARIFGVMVGEGLHEPVSFETVFQRDGRTMGVHAYR